jgi:DNA-binding GntR family transcriptional regulator
MNLADKAYEQLHKEIITCVLAPGQQIAQAQMAEKFGLGLTPVREALTRLAHEKLVQAVPRFGYVVSPIILSDVASMYELRIILETASVRMAISKATDQQLEEIVHSANFTYVYNAPESNVAFLERNAAFHCSIAKLSNNSRLVETLQNLLDELTRIFYIGLNLRDSTEEMRGEHLDISEALLKRDTALAENIMRNQIEKSQLRVLEALKSSSLNSASIISSEGILSTNFVFLGEKRS